MDSAKIVLPMMPTACVDFETGKLTDVARYQRPHRRREYALLACMLVLASLPYAIAFVIWPFAALCVVLFAAYFQVLISFATSSGTDTAHHIRFLLCGSNPIGMTGASSLLFGAVDSVLDWKEDAAERNRNGFKFCLLTCYKFLITPIGAVLMAAEYLWDALLMGRPSLVAHKWRELFALAYYHDLICPEKSNDLFYADLSFARYKGDPYLYQWNRMRALVFELKHQFEDAMLGVGVPETNLFLQDDVAAYQTLKRLQVEVLEDAVDRHYSQRIDEFPIPPALATQLVQNARPIAHYLRMRSQLTRAPGIQSNLSRELRIRLGDRPSRQDRIWKLLRLLDEPANELSSKISRYISRADLEDMAAAGILRQLNQERFEWSPTFIAEFESQLARLYEPPGEAQLLEALAARVPEVLVYRGQTFVPARHGSD